jgi:hypothetical protein
VPIRELVVELAQRGVFFDPTLSIDEYGTLFLYDVEADHPNNRYLTRAFVAVNLGSEHEIFRIPAAMRLCAATINAAQALHKQQVLGTLEAGKYADVVVLRANPLDDIRNTAVCRGRCRSILRSCCACRAAPALGSPA